MLLQGVVRALLHKCLTSFALFAINSSGDLFFFFWKWLEKGKRQFTTADCQSFFFLTNQGIKASLLSRRGLLVGLTFIHIINLIHPADSLSKAATHHSDSGNDMRQCLESGQISRHFFVSERIGLTVSILTASCLCSPVAVNTWISFLNKCLSMVHQQHLIMLSLIMLSNSICTCFPFQPT